MFYNAGIEEKEAFPAIMREIHRHAAFTWLKASADNDTVDRLYSATGLPRDESGLSPGSRLQRLQKHLEERLRKNYPLSVATIVAAFLDSVVVQDPKVAADFVRERGEITKAILAGVRSLKAGRPAHGIYHGVRGGHGANQGGES